MYPVVFLFIFINWFLIYKKTDGCEAGPCLCGVSESDPPEIL